jgi:hypothetical protein
MHDQVKIFSPLPNDFPNQGHRVAIDCKTSQRNLIPVMDESTHSLLRCHQLIGYAWRNLHDAIDRLALMIDQWSSSNVLC